MIYHVEFTATAERDAYETYTYIAIDSQVNAQRWYENLGKAIDSLREMPRRCVLAPESQTVGQEIRQLLFGYYRILFVIRDSTVLILYVRHGSRRTISANDNSDANPNGA